MSTAKGGHPFFCLAPLGRANDAIDYLWRAFAEGHAFGQRAGASPEFDALRDHPRFQALLERMGLVSRWARYLRAGITSVWTIVPSVPVMTTVSSEAVASTRATWSCPTIRR